MHHDLRDDTGQTRSASRHTPVACVSTGLKFVSSAVPATSQEDRHAFHLLGESFDALPIHWEGVRERQDPNTSGLAPGKSHLFKATTIGTSAALAWEIASSV